MKKIKKKRIISSIVIVLVLIAGFYPVIVNKVTSTVYTTTSNKLKVYVLDNDQTSLALLSQYKNRFLDTEVEEVFFDTQEELYSKMSSDSLAGEGPDVIFGDGISLKRVTKLLDSGIFLDLNPIMKQDDTFFIEEYNQKVMDAGVYGDERLFVPIDYNVSSIMTTKSVLEYCKIDNLNGSENLEDIISVSSNYLSDSSNEKKRIFCPTVTSFTDFLQNCNIEAIDYKGKKARFDDEKVIQLMESYKNIVKRNNSEEKDSEFNYLNENNKIKEKKVIFSNYPIGSGFFRYEEYSRMKSLMNEDPIIFPLYSNSTVKIGKYMAINSNTKNTEGAYKLIKMALSYEAQSANIYAGIPVNKKAYDYSVQQGKELIGRTYDTTKMVDLPEELKTASESAATGFDRVILEDITIEELVNEEINLYINGKKTAKTAAADMQNKITLYLNE